jgi:clan AA aspartic protease
VNGIVDESGRALLRLRVKHPTEASETELDVWVDTGFTGELVVPRRHIAFLNLPLGPAVKAALADGSEIRLDTYTCMIEWFGTWKRIEIVASGGQFPLLGVGLLLDRELRVDYRARTLGVT